MTDETILKIIFNGVKIKVIDNFVVIPGRFRLTASYKIYNSIIDYSEDIKNYEIAGYFTDQDKQQIYVVKNKFGKNDVCVNLNEAFHYE